VKGQRPCQEQLKFLAQHRAAAQVRATAVAAVLATHHFPNCGDAEDLTAEDLTAEDFTDVEPIQVEEAASRMEEDPMHSDGLWGGGGRHRCEEAPDDPMGLSAPLLTPDLPLPIPPEVAEVCSRPGQYIPLTFVTTQTVLRDAERQRGKEPIHRYLLFLYWTLQSLLACLPKLDLALRRNWVASQAVHICVLYVRGLMESQSVQSDKSAKLTW